MDTVSRYGVDIAVRRADDLDRRLLSIVQEKPASVLELGSGAGGQSIRLVQAGAEVTAVDIGKYKAAYATLIEQYALRPEQLSFIQADLRQLTTIVPRDVSYTHCLLQRTLHYLPYPDAVQLLRYCRQIVQGQLFVSVTGIDTAIGAAYPACAIPIEDRFAKLPADAAKTFSITEPLCLYSEAEFRSLLIETGWEIEELWVSAFGNIKVIAN